MPKFCTECGNQLSTNDKFCAQCGTPSKTQKAAQEAQHPNEQPSQPPKPSESFWFSWTGLFLLTAIAGLALVLMNPQASSGVINTQANTGVFNKSLICKAIISTVMAQPANIINTDKTSGEITYLSYKRPNDGTHWHYKCKTSGNRAIWGSNSSDTSGRWRDSSNDNKIMFSVNGNSLSIKEVYPGGSENTQNFSYAELL